MMGCWLVLYPTSNKTWHHNNSNSIILESGALCCAIPHQLSTEHSTTNTQKRQNNLLRGTIITGSLS